MAGAAVVQVLGHPRLLHGEGCPEELLEEVLTLESSDGETFEVEAVSACMSRTILADVNAGETKITLPVTGKVLSKVVDYFNQHKGVAPAELQIPMPSDDLVECGASKWDATFVKVEKDVLFDLMVAASLLSIPSLMLLTAAKAATVVKEKESAAVRKLIGVKNDMGEEEEEEINEKYLEDRRTLGFGNPDNQPLQGVAAIMFGLTTAAEKSGVLSLDGKQPMTTSGTDISSWSHINWRAIVMTDWKRLDEAPEELKNDRELMFAAASMSSGNAAKFASLDLREDEQFFLYVVSLNPSMLSEAARKLRDSREFIMKAIMINGEALDSATEALRGDRGLVLEAAKNRRGSALKGATAALRGDSELVLQCSKEDPQSFSFASEDLRGSKDFVLQAVKVNGKILQYVPRVFQADADVVTAALAQNDEAAAFAHTSRRVEVGLTMPWDSTKAHQDKVKDDEQLGKRPKEFVAPPRRTPAGIVRQRGDEENGYVMNMNLQKSTQFSAMNTMSANMGQFNYISSNSFLDKLPFMERPTIDSFTLMWGPVGAIGMRQKAFASADMLNMAPENLMSVLDATKILHQVLTKMDPPEWFNPCFFDQASREGFLKPTAGVISGPGSWQGENYWSPPPRADGGQQQRREKKEAEGEDEAKGEESRGEVLPGPLGGWPRLAAPQDYPTEVVQEDDLELEEGVRVRLTGLPSQNGLMGSVVKSHSDGRWKVVLDGKMGKALLKAEFLKVIAAPISAGVLPSLTASRPAAPEVDEVEVVDEDEVEELQPAPAPTDAAPVPAAAAPAAGAAPGPGRSAEAEAQEASAAPASQEVPPAPAEQAAAAGEVTADRAAQPEPGAKAAAAERRRREIEEKRSAMKAKTEERKAALKAATEARRQARTSGS